MHEPNSATASTSMVRNERNMAARGFTLIELLVVIAIIAIVSSGIVAVGMFVRTTTRVNATKGTIQILTSALSAWQSKTGGDFPQDVPNMFAGAATMDLQTAGQIYLNIYASGQVLATADPAGMHATYSWNDAGDLTLNQKNYVLDARARSELMCFFLSQEPASRKLLDGLDASTRVNEDQDQYQVGLRPVAPLYEVVDAWGKPIDYVPRGLGNFPRVVSAGPDGVFGNADDISSDDL